MQYGKTNFEDELEQTIKSREIVKEILDFGVSDFQKIKIIELLGLELEDRALMLKIVGIVKSSDELQSEEKQKLITLD
jgi:hypothetical protein|tara:strand:- start:40 stop:273 length:234 start_codon:yes stop_codon:yes gene_type:complete